MLSAQAIERIDRELTKFPADQKQSAVMAALAIAQAELGNLSTETMNFVAGYLGMAPVAVYEVATFYSLYQRAAGGRNRLRICTNLPCVLSGAGEAAEHLKHKLGIGFGAATADGAFKLEEGECFGACGDAPVVLHNERRMLIGMTPAKLDELLAELAK